MQDVAAAAFEGLSHGEVLAVSVGAGEQATVSHPTAQGNGRDAQAFPVVPPHLLGRSVGGRRVQVDVLALEPPDPRTGWTPLKSVPVLRLAPTPSLGARDGRPAGRGCNVRPARGERRAEQLQEPARRVGGVVLCRLGAGHLAEAIPDARAKALDLGARQRGCVA